MTALVRVLLVLLLVAGFAPSQTAMLSVQGTVPNGYLGRSVASAGDVNNDGIPDFAAGVSGQPPSLTGEVRMLSGFDGSLIWAVSGVAAGDQFGDRLFSAGDVDGDGVTDVAAGSEYAAGGVGQIRILSGSTGATIRTITGQTSTSPLRLADAGRDFDNDGVPDVCGIGGSMPYSTRVFSGATGGVIATVPPYTYGLGQAASASFITDLNADGIVDLLVGSWSALNLPGVQPDQGRVIALLGPSATYFFGLNGGPSYVSNFGAGVRDIGDVNGDGAPDALIVCGNITALAPAFAQVHSGANGSLLYALTQPIPDYYQGGAIARLGDLTGDGRPDFALRVNTGIGVYSGASGALLFTSAGDGAVDGAGDVNGDSIPDVLVGSPGFGGTGFNFGRVRVLSGVVLGAATATNLGGGCGASGAPLLASTPPVIGAPITFNLSGGTPGAWGNLAIDVAPSSAATFGPCIFHLDLAHAANWSYVPVVASGLGGATVNLFIPGVPTLAGVQATLQVVLFGTAGPLGYDISNGIGLVAGF